MNNKIFETAYMYDEICSLKIYVSKEKHILSFLHKHPSTKFGVETFLETERHFLDGHFIDNNIIHR